MSAFSTKKEKISRLTLCKPSKRRSANPKPVELLSSKSNAVQSLRIYKTDAVIEEVLKDLACSDLEVAIIQDHPKSISGVVKRRKVYEALQLDNSIGESHVSDIMEQNVSIEPESESRESIVMRMNSTGRDLTVVVDNEGEPVSVVTK